MASTKTAGRTTTTRATTTRATTRAEAADTGKVRPRGKGKGTKAAPAAPAATAPAGTSDAGSVYVSVTAPEAAISCGDGPGQAEPGANGVHPGRARKPVAGRAAKKIADALKMAGEATRVRIIWNLRANGPMNVTAMCRSFGVGQPAVSHHLSLLRHAGIVEARRDGKMSQYSLTPRGELLAEAMTGIEAAG